jgi:hypothetical protein
MTVTIRRATLYNIDQLVPLFDAYRQFYGQHSDRILARQFLSDRLVRNESVVLIPEDCVGSVVGFAQLYPTFSSILAAPMYVLSDLFVIPESDGEVLGRCCFSQLSKRLVPPERFVWNWRPRSPIFQHDDSTNHWGGRGRNFTSMA